MRISGSRFSVLSGQVARLERALTNYFLDFFTGLDRDRKYEEVAVPLIVTRSTLESTGRDTGTDRVFSSHGMVDCVFVALTVDW